VGEFAVRIHIDEDACSGSASCVRLAPGLLRMSADGLKSEIVPGGAASDQEMWNAAEACPWGAVLLEDENGTQLFP
jgi:ferredoxin